MAEIRNSQPQNSKIESKFDVQEINTNVGVQVESFYDNHWIKSRHNSIIGLVEEKFGKSLEIGNSSNSWRYAYNMRLIKLRRVLQGATSDSGIQ